MERRVSRVRVSDLRIASGATNALARRTGRGTGRPAAPAGVSQYFGADDDTPVLEFLKSIRPNTDSFRGGEHVHVSDVVSKCIRKIALMRRLNVRHPVESVFDGQGITFAIGDAVHDYIKARFVKGHPEKVWAKWTCGCGQSGYTGTYATRPKKPCTECGMPLDKQNEVPFVHEAYKVKGTPDLLLWLEQYAAMFIVEIKSMAAEMFKELARPLPNHKVQIALYWHILKACDMPVVDRCSLLYANKEFSFKLPYKEFMFDPREVDLSAYWDDLEALKAAADGKSLPPRVVCGADNAPEAKKCPVCVTCFQSP